MEVLKWIGYIVAAIVVLTAVVGGGLFIAAIVGIGGVLLCLVGLVMFIAAIIKGCWETRGSQG